MYCLCFENLLLGLTCNSFVKKSGVSPYTGDYPVFLTSCTHVCKQNPTNRCFPQGFEDISLSSDALLADGNLLAVRISFFGTF